MEPQLDALMHDLQTALRAMGIPVSKKIEPAVQVNTRAKRRLGCCIYANGRYTIEVAAALLEDEGKLKETLLHELLHTCPGCRNHGEKWKFWAAKVNEAMGVSIARLSPAQGPVEPLRQDEVKYILKCTRCGLEIPRRRMSKAVKYPWRYRCKCGGKLQLLRVTPEN